MDVDNEERQRWCLPDDDEFDVTMPNHYIDAKIPVLNEDELEIATTMPDEYLARLLTVLSKSENKDKDKDLCVIFCYIKTGDIPGKKNSPKFYLKCNVISVTSLLT